MMAAASMSPQASPRLPSPPPIAEDQLGSRSPLRSTKKAEGSLDSAFVADDGATRRIRPGTKSKNMPEGPPLIDISEINTAYQLTEHLKALYSDVTHSKDSDSTIPVSHEVAVGLAIPPEGIDRAIWLYELCRFLCQKVNSIIIALFSDEPACSAQTCSEMRASEWQYLCAVHDPPKPCCAIDYCCHTLDWAANVLTSQKHFPSRMTLGSEQGASHQQMRQLTNIFRRVYRIFAHAWFQHREMFWKVEAKNGLYMFFKTVCDEYNLIPEDNYTIPPEAEGKEPENGDQSKSLDDIPSLNAASADMKNRTDQSSSGAAPSAPVPPLPPHKSQINPGHTTKRHRTTPSMDASAISTVVEETEEDDSKSIAESIITTIEEDAKITYTEDKGLGISTNGPKKLETENDGEDIVTGGKEDAVSTKSLLEDLSELQQSAAAVKEVDGATEDEEKAEAPTFPFLASSELPSMQDSDIKPTLDTASTDETSEIASALGASSNIKVPETSVAPAKGSPRLKSDELKSKIPVAKKDTPVKEGKRVDAKAPGSLSGEDKAKGSPEVDL